MRSPPSALIAPCRAKAQPTTATRIGCAFISSSFKVSAVYRHRVRELALSYKSNVHSNVGTSDSHRQGGHSGAARPFRNADIAEARGYDCFQVSLAKVGMTEIGARCGRTGPGPARDCPVMALRSTEADVRIMQAGFRCRHRVCAS